jgi:hypothetical protein
VATVEINILTAKQQREYVGVDHHVLHLSPRRAELIASIKGPKSSSPSVLPCSAASEGVDAAPERGWRKIAHLQAAHNGGFCFWTQS